MTSTDTNKLMREALLDQLGRVEPDKDGALLELRRQLARVLINKAINGDLGAIREVHDRIDGRPTPPTKVPEPPRKVVLRWLGEEDQDMSAAITNGVGQP